MNKRSIEMIGYDELICGGCGTFFIVISTLVIYVYSKKWWKRREEIYRSKYNRAVGNTLKKTKESDDKRE
jgi:hypothetical protein